MLPPPLRPSRRAASACVVLMLVVGAPGSYAQDGTPGSTPLARPRSAPEADAYDEDAARSSADETAQTSSASPQPEAPREEDGEPDRDPGADAPPNEQPSPPTGAPSPPEVAQEVELHEPDLVVRAGDGGLSRADAEVAGIDHLAAVGELTATIDDPDGQPRELELLAVDAAEFRPLTPEVTAQSPGVWQRLEDGDVLVRHDVAHQLDLELGGTIELMGEAGPLEVRIGALAANGAPPFAEVVVPGHVAAQLGQPDLTALIVAVADDHAPETVAASLEELGEVERHRAPEPERAAPRPTSGSVELEPFTYTSRGDGTIAIHGDWAARNIVSIQLPGMGTARCHRAMVPQLYAALQEIIDEGLYDHLEPEQYGGCWSPRHILFNPSRSLSMHAWGLAIDFNVRDNGYGATPQMDPRIVEIFERWGFEWGGRWSTPDGMHFELDRFVQVE